MVRADEVAAELPAAPRRPGRRDAAAGALRRPRFLNPAKGRPMEPHRNALGQPIGAPLPGWTKRPLPPRTPLAGRFCRIEPLDAGRHAADLWAANGDDREGR